MVFRRNKHGLLLKQDFDTVIHACKVIGDAVFDSPNSGMVDDKGNTYIPDLVVRESDEIQEALSVVNAYFGLEEQT